MLVCDAARLRQVLINLVGNAVKFTEAGSVEASLSFDPADGGRLRVAVRDTGVGIPEAAKRHLFQRFTQVDSAETRLRGGTGLGLAISRQLVELMGGEITVESVPGLGSTFRFWVPAQPSDAARPVREGAAAGPPAVPEMPSVRVLVAEDNPTNRHVIAAYLALAGHSAHVVTDGQAALAAVRDGGFDLVIMDIQMPGMDGLTAAGHIRALVRARGRDPDHRADRQRHAGRPRALPRGRHVRLRRQAGVARGAAAPPWRGASATRTPLPPPPASSRRRGRSCRWRRRRRACPRRGRPRRRSPPRRP